MNSRLLPVGIGLLALSVAYPKDPPISAGARESMLSKFEKTLAESSKAIEQAPDRVALYSQRGDCHLFLGHFADAVADYEKMIALDRAQEAQHWRLGIAYYFVGDFRKSARQFEKYYTYDKRDRENGIWKFLAQAKLDGLAKARADMLVYTEFDREPFPALYDLFAGRVSEEKLFAKLDRKGLQHDAQVHFFAHYYVGLNQELLGQRRSARDHLHQAIALFPEENSRPPSVAYMWQVARLQSEALPPTLDD